MSDTPEVKVEDILGWEFVPELCRWMERQNGGKTLYFHFEDGAQVDHMAAWLDAEIGPALWSIQRGPAGHLVYWDAGVREGQTAEFPTIRGALAAAVRTLAGAS